MAETADTTNTTVSTPQPQSESSKRSRSDETSCLKRRRSDATSEVEDLTKEAKSGGIVYSVWPPSQNSRERILNSLIKKLSTDSFLSYKYGTIKPEEASAVAKSIEEEAYNIASRFVSRDGIKNLEAYTNEISERVIESAEVRFKANGTKSTKKDDDLEEKTQP
ncbi:unnamed protein product [Arabidopsis arenosa]|uniref:WPP domain-containing protein n=1 Tax=Arabidopsis arenosa TaxID=38785 RepID=A0A8S2ANK1_ARAAE|nr:unnamed protein product [Arabidopsis arenosa]